MSNLLGLEEERPVSASTGEYDNAVPEIDPDLVARAKRGANWYYWIAGLSVVNSVAFLAGANFHFLAGLGVTEVVDAVVEAMIQQGGPGYIRVVAVVFDLIAVAGFGLAGYFASKLSRTAFLVGIIVYIIDALIVLLLTDFLMLAFHAFALFSLIRGYLACREIKSQLPPPPSAGPPPPSAA